MTKLIGSLFAILLLAATPARAGEAEDKAAILNVIATMEQAWNRGDFRGYMAGFWNPGVVFVSGGKIQAGWQGTLDHYVRDYGGAPEKRGNLHFYDMTVDMLAPDAALLISHYHLERPEHPQEGINTRLFRKIDGRWVIAMNHVSSYEAHAAK
ncbi:nuclear transport factor 2 family protein [Sphingomonas sp.]|uniref:YybH family protein n=1 Tax=Sphingomonas sp. TaxID=28214 RepID=UPI002DC010A5|nr:nuclear transport factor 2 family protein [Sphingomonas sp.]HEU4969852.1 nuclear transport factor 2 family protein [Sphingomonas sp.]